MRPSECQAPPQVEVEDVPCPLGCPPNDEQLVIGYDQDHDIPGRFPVVKCKTCGLMRTNPRPTAETIGVYYPTEYTPYQYTRAQNSAAQSPTPLWKKLAKKVLEFNGQRIPELEPGEMLELGSAGGSFLGYMESKGWQVHGIEPDPTAAEWSQQAGLDVQNCQLENAVLPNEQYDLVVAWMVVEHLHDLVGGLRRLRDATKPGGMFVMSVPNAGALERKLFADYWFALDVPRHTYHFTPSTMRKVLAASGWTMERVLHHREFRNLMMSLNYITRDLGLTRTSDRLRSVAGSRWFTYAALPAGYVAGAAGQTGRMTIWARRN